MMEKFNRKFPLIKYLFRIENRLALADAY